MKNSKLKMIVMSLMMLLFSGVNTFAQEAASDNKQLQAKHEMKEGHRRSEKGSRIPNLTEEQKEQLKAAKIKLQRKTLPIKNALGEKKARLQTLKTTDGSSEKELNKVIEEIGALKTKMMKAKTAHHMEIKKFLTEEQKLFLDSHAGKKKHDTKMHK